MLSSKLHSAENLRRFVSQHSINPYNDKTQFDNTDQFEFKVNEKAAL